MAIAVKHIAESGKDIDDVGLDTWKTFKDDNDPIDYLPSVPSKGSCMFVYRRSNLTDDEFPPTIMGKNMVSVADILIKFPVDEQVSATQLHPQRTQQHLTESLESMHREPTKFTDSQGSMQREQEPLAVSLWSMQREPKWFTDSQESMQREHKRLADSLQNMKHNQESMQQEQKRLADSLANMQQTFSRIESLLAQLVGSQYTGCSVRSHCYLQSLHFPTCWRCLSCILKMTQPSR